jgi:hypothetical protein
MADQAERVILEAEDQVTPIVGKANDGLESFEKKAESSHGKVIRITDQTRSSVQRLISSLEKQAETYGKSGVEKLITQRDQLFQRYSKEPVAIDAITRSYQKMIDTEVKAAQATAEAERKRAEARAAMEKAAAGQATMGWMQDPWGSLRSGASELLTAIGPLGGMIAGGVAALGAMAVAGWEAAKSLANYGLEIKNVELRTGLTTKEVGQFSFAARMAGQDASIFERMMRGLSQAANEESKEGEKARATLRGMGVEMHSLTGDLKPTSTLLLEIADGLNKLPEGAQRDAAAMDLFKRAGIEAIPVISGLTENIKRAKELGLGATDEDLKRWEEYHRNVTEAEVLWERFARKIKEPLAAVVTFVLKDQSGRQYSLDDLQKRGVNLGQWAPRTDWQREQDMKAAGYGQGAAWMTGGMISGALDYTSKIEERQRADAAVRAFGGREGLAGQLKQAEESLSKMAKPELGISSIKDVGDYAAAEKKVESLKEQIEAAKHATEQMREFHRAAAEFEKKGDESELGAVGKIYYQRDLLLKQAAQVKASEADIAAIRKAANEQALTEAVKEHVKDLNAAMSEQNKLIHEHVEELNRDLAEQRKHDEQVQRTRERIESIGLQAQREGLQREAARAGRMAELTAGSEEDAAQQAYQVRVKLALDLAGIEMARISRETDANEKAVLAAQARKDLFTQLAQAQDQFDEKQAQIQQQRQQELQSQTDGLQKQAEKLFDVLFTKPKNFGKDLMNTVRSAVIKPVTETLGGAAANALHPIIYGSDGQGGLNGLLRGTSRDPVRVSTDQNTAATMQNSAIMASLTAIIAAGIGVAPPHIATGGAGVPGISMPSISLPTSTPAVGGYSTAVGGYSSAAGGPVVNMSYAPIPGPGGGFSGGSYGGEAPSIGSEAPSIFNLPVNRSPFTTNPLAMMLGSRNAPGILQQGGLSGLKSQFWNENINLSPGVTRAASSMGFGGDLAGVLTSKGAAGIYTSVGAPLLMSGLTGGNRGSWTGTGMDIAGGALTGAGIGTMILPGIGTAIGAGVGAAAGFVAGGLEQLLGVESPAVKAQHDIKSIYGVNIPQNSGTIKQVVQIAQSQFGGDVAVAVRSPSVRQLVMLYSEATGQKMPLSATTPYAGSLVEQGGKLYQQATYQDGQAHTYASSLPTLAGIGGGSTYPTPGGPNTSSGGGTSLTINLNGQPISADFVADQYGEAQNASYGRTQQSANMQVPGLMVA